MGQTEEKVVAAPVLSNGYLLEKDAKKFIENDGSKRYRISTHPDFVTYERGNLLKHAEAEVRAVAKKTQKDSRGEGT